MAKMQKNLEKSQNLSAIERQIFNLKAAQQGYYSMANESPNWYVLVDNSEVKQATIDKVAEWLEVVGDILKKMASTELQ
jgi:hypothetical protein